MIRNIIKILGLLSVSTLGHAAITAYGLSTNPFIGNTQNIQKKIQICYLDEYDISLAAVNNDLRNYHNPNPPSLTAEEQAKFKAISHSLLCRYQAKELGIKKLPAIVFGAKNVIYGERDLNKALEEYQDHAK